MLLAQSFYTAITFPRLYNIHIVMPYLPEVNLPSSLGKPYLFFIEPAKVYSNPNSP